ncbi:hypothetical protein Pcinc_013834 [Petrolisthes cinctipes]|uniref:SRCR domain-containing protein n=1 Tax=Petrolisthes cinctipes TaxID=88211 RepID=A0AAE1KPW4_PETCI|nr:hypothetical protein Pcinc_013834 [Petrolisthes cinctipes]
MVGLQVVCRSLGLRNGWMAPIYDNLENGTGPVWLEKLRCQGDETWLGECPGASWGTSSCNHIRDVSVFCYDQGVKVRLAGGERPETGRVEVRLGGQWGTICDDLFDHLDAQVVCGMLGYRGVAVTVKGLGLGKGPMWQMALECMGSEKNLQQCRIKLLSKPCSRFQPAAVTCSNIASDVDAALSSLLPQECGQTEDASTRFLTMLTKVRGGLTPTRFSTPWLVNLRFNNAGRSISCGGNIISEDLVLTAAHCLSYGTSSLVVRVGDHNSGYYEDTEQQVGSYNMTIKQNKITGGSHHRTRHLNISKRQLQWDKPY